ncbi:peptidase MA family metallohydrolase [Sorangium sp. So ce854]|uniref:peptidase MA family metallohydrolase n=1 Tax=Sorangium sp. So ce854 TaxID=3133322 RepID=UPI003F63CAAF
MTHPTMTHPTRRSPATLGHRLAALLCLAIAAAPGLAGAAPRVYDASAASLDGKAALAIPPPPPEYHTENLGWIEFAYRPSTRDRVRPLIAQAGAIRAELSDLLGRPALVDPVKVRIAAVPAELDRLVPGELAGPATAASFGALRLAVLSASPRHGVGALDLEGAFRHALAHLALDEATAGAPLPRWFHEGFAAHAAGERAALRAQRLAIAALRGHLLPLDDLEASLAGAAEPAASVAHAQSADVVRYLVEGERRERFTRALDAVRAGAPLADALESAHASTRHDLELAWRADVARRYGFLPALVGSLVLLGLLVAGGRGVQRLRARRSAAPPAPHRRLRAAPEARHRPARASTARLVATLGARHRGEGDGDAGIPKVEHNGQWHTLH